MVRLVKREVNEMLSCVKYQQRLSAFLDGELDYRQARAVEDHLASCEACCKALAKIRGLSICLHNLEVPPPPSNLTSRILTAARTHQRRDDIRSKNICSLQDTFFKWAWLFKGATGVALIAGLVLGAFMGWDTGRFSRSLMEDTASAGVIRMEAEINIVDAFSGLQRGSIEAAMLTLLEI